MQAVITSGQLGKLGAQLGEGGEARVYHAPKLSLADAPGALAFKEYKAGHRPPHALRRLVAIRNGLDDAARRRMDELTAWPVRVVEEAGRVRGVVLRVIPDGFFQDRVLPGTGRRQRTPREVQNLLIPPERARLVGMPTPNLKERVEVCRDFAAALHFVHRQNLVVGDLNAKNALFRTDAKPRVMLVDCDAIRIKGSVAAVAQLNAPDWDPPEAALTQQSDRYKFGLFVLRCLGTGDQLSTTRDPSRADGALDQTGRRLLRSALSDVPGSRTTAQDWGRYFDGTLGSSVPPPLPAPRPPSNDRTSGWRRNPQTRRWEKR